MDILYLLIPISLIFVAIIAWVFIWSVKSGQYDDMERTDYQESGRVKVEVSDVKRSSFDDFGWMGMQSLAFILACVDQELSQLGNRRRDAGQVEPNATTELRVTADRRRRDPVTLPTLTKQPINILGGTVYGVALLGQYGDLDNNPTGDREERTKHDDHLEGMADADFQTFYKEFGIILKEGIYLDAERKERLSKLVRFATTKSEGALKSLETYVADMQEGQEHIYYLTGANAESLADNPLLEKLRAMDYEVLLLTDPVDEFVSDVLTEFDGKKLKSAEKGDLDLGDEPAQEEQKKELENLVTYLKETLSEEISDVHVSGRLTDSAVCLAADEDQVSAMMAKMIKASGQETGTIKRILEINPEHALIKAVESLRKENAEAPELVDYAKLLYDLALVGEGAALKNPAKFAKQMGELAAKALGS